MEDKVVIVTGAGSGIGEATVKLFASQGAKVVLSDINLPAIQEIAGELSDASAIATDVSKLNQVEALISQTVSQYGRLDIMVNNAGIGPKEMNRTAEHSLEDWDSVIAVNQTGVFYCMKMALAQMMIQGHGSIVNVASLAGLKASPNNLSYSASKFAVVGMTKSAAMEYASKNIRINAVCPGYTHSALLDQLLGMRPDMDEILKKHIPMNRFGEPAEIAEAILWLASDHTKFITGQTITLDGGTSL